MKLVAAAKETQRLGLDYTVISVGKKGNAYFLGRPYIPVDKFLEGSNLLTAKEAQAITDDVFSLFISEEVDKVKLLYTKFVSLVKSDPDPVQILDALLPLYLNSQILRALQESIASDLAARMSAMSNATDNAQLS
ncbi:hypothetical protein BUALT_Bualt18G0100900 [Buddleja alternifolia]|uniref:F-ATPase gamma subunit n=1 Tax=Buddleja alternifolia TaxID=168488 RepID=A0AAV6WEE7_9LAMI|nr:hypothetical protein BUALT_Bualt18G0100900 [Buddleja alternifolia]